MPLYQGDVSTFAEEKALFGHISRLVPHTPEVQEQLCSLRA
jgi:hypothetical protein